MLLFTYLKGRAKQMDYFTKEGMKKLLEDEEVVRRLTVHGHGWCGLFRGGALPSVP